MITFGSIFYVNNNTVWETKNPAYTFWGELISLSNKYFVFTLYWMK